MRDSYHSLCGESAQGEEVTGVTVFGAKTLAERQMEEDDVDGAIIAIESLMKLRALLTTFGDSWLFFFEDHESEMRAVRASSLQRLSLFVVMRLAARFQIFWVESQVRSELSLDYVMDWLSRRCPVLSFAVSTERMPRQMPSLER